MQDNARRSSRDPYSPHSVVDDDNGRYDTWSGSVDHGEDYRRDEQRFEPSPLFRQSQERLNQFERSNDARESGWSGTDRGGRGPVPAGGIRSLPKGYKRSDERIRDDICETLSRSGTDIRDVSVEVSGGRVVLEGTVLDRYAKHEIEDHAAECLGVEDVENRIRVRR